MSFPQLPFGGLRNRRLAIAVSNLVIPAPSLITSASDIKVANSDLVIEPTFFSGDATSLEVLLTSNLLPKTIGYFKFDDTSNTLYSYDSTGRFRIYSQYNTATYYTGKIGNAINRNTTSPSYAMSVQKTSGTLDTPIYNFGGFVGIGFWFKVQEEIGSESFSKLLELKRDGEIWDIESSYASVRIRITDASATVFSAEIFKADSSPFYDEIYDPETGISTYTWNWQFILIEIDPSNQLFRARLNNETLTTASYIANGSLSERYISLPRFGNSMLIDELYLYDSALSETDRNSLYNSGNGLSYPFT